MNTWEWNNAKEIEREVGNNSKVYIRVEKRLIEISKQYWIWNRHKMTRNKTYIRLETLNKIKIAFKTIYNT